MKYKLHDNILDDCLDSEQKTWDDDDTKSEIYRIVSNPEHIVPECEEEVCPEANDKDEAGRSVKQTPGVGSEEVHLVCEEAGSFEDETSPPEISFISSVRKLQQETEQESYQESLLYKTRMWAKTHLGDILENYALYCEKEEAMKRRRSEYESGGSDGLGSEQDLDLVELIREDTSCEYDCYYNSSRRYISPYVEQPHSYYELRGNVRTRALDDRRPRDHYIDTMNELQKIVDAVTDYLAGREEEISKYEGVHLDDKSKMVDKDKVELKADEVKEETAVEQGITGVKNAMNSLFSSLVGAKSTCDTTDTTTTTTAYSLSPLQSESGISKLLSFTPKSNGSLTPIAVVPPAHQALSADKKSPLQSLLVPQSTENNHPVNEVVRDTATSPEAQGSSASQPVVESVLGRLSPFRIFGDKQAGEATETPDKSHESTESKEALMDKAKTLSTEQSASQPVHQSSCGGSCSGSVELLPETESSGEIPDVPKETTLKPEENPNAKKTADDTGFFNPFKKSLTSFMTSPAPVSKTAESNSVFSIFKPAEGSKPEDSSTSGTIGDKLKLSFFSSDAPATPQAPKQESGLLSGLLKLGPGDDATTSKEHASNTSTKSPLLSRALLLESVPKGNTDTGWFSNLFKMNATESPKPQCVSKFPSKPAATMNIPTVVVAPEAREDSSIVSKDMAQEEQMAREDKTPKSDIQSFPESLTDPGNEKQCIKTDTQADPLQQQDQAQSEEEEEAMSKPQDLLTMFGDNKTSDKPQEGGLFSTLFSPITNTTNKSQAQQDATPQSSGLFSGLLKMTSTENSGTSNKPDGAQQLPVNSKSQLDSTSPAAIQKQSEEHKVTSQKGFLAGLFSKGSEEDSTSKLKNITASHENDENNSSVGKDLLFSIFKSESNESSKTAVSTDSTDTTALPQSSGLLSGLFKLASNTVSSSPATPTQQSSQNILKPATTQGSNQPLSETATPTSHPGGLLSGLFRLSSSENTAASGNVVPDQQPEQPGTSGGQQPNQKQPTTQSNAPPVPPQSGGIFGGIRKLTENTLAPSSTQQPISGTGSHPNQKSAEPSATGGILSGFLNKISAAENTATPSQQPHLPATNKDPKLSQQPASSEQGIFLSSLFGINTSETNSGIQESPQNVNAEAQPSTSAGILSSFFNKIVDTASQSSQSDPKQSTAPQPSPGLFSGLFSTNKTPTQPQKAPSGTQMKQQQGNRQSLQRQHQIPAQPAAAPESQQGGLFSGLFNKLTSTDTPPQHNVAEGSSSQETCRSRHPGQDNQSPSAGQGQTEVFKTSPVTTASTKFSAEQQHPSIGLHQQSNKQSPQAPAGAAQKKCQPGGLLSSILKMSASEESQPGEDQSNSQTPNKLEAQSSDFQESGILSGFLNKISLKTEDKPDSSIPSDQKPQQHEERKPGQNRPQIQRAKPIEQESTQDGDQKAPSRKGFLSGLFTTGSEDNSLPKSKETNEPKVNFSTGKGTTTGVLKSETSSVTCIPGAKTSTQTSTEEPLTMHPAVKSTQIYLEEVHRLLYGTVNEYGYQDLLYLFAEHGIIAPDLYEHQCLIEALLWQQLNDYALLEALEAQAQDYYTGLPEAASSNHHETVMQEPGWWNLKTMDPKQFHIPSYPWQNAESSSITKRLPQADTEDDIVFDMRVKSRNRWASCDHVEKFSDQTSRNKRIEKDSTGTPAKLTRCQSLSDCRIYGKHVQNGTLKPQVDWKSVV